MKSAEKIKDKIYKDMNKDTPKDMDIDLVCYVNEDTAKKLLKILKD